MKLGKHDKKIKRAASLAAGPVVATAYQIHLNKMQAKGQSGDRQKNQLSSNAQNMQALLKNPALAAKTVSKMAQKKLGLK